MAILFENMDNFINEVLNQTLSSQNQSIQEKAVSILANFICITNSDFVKTMKWDTKSNTLCDKFYCLKCHLQDNSKKELLKTEYGIDDVVVIFQKVNMEEMSSYSYLKYILAHLSGGCTPLKIASLSQLISFSSHVKEFHSKNVTTIWIESVGDNDEKVRKELTQVIGSVLRSAQVSI